MTTQLPYEPPQYANYPAAPPWATPQAPPAAPVSPGSPRVAGPPTAHGQLMVAYPELMQSPARSTAPSVVPAVIYTFVFGLFGAISASRRADRAARNHHRRSPYWIAFAATLVAHTLASALAIAALAPVYLDVRAAAVTQAVQSNIRAASGASGATCQELPENRADGRRSYSCKLTFSNTRAGTVRVVADSDGNVLSTT